MFNGLFVSFWINSLSHVILLFVFLINMFICYLGFWLASTKLYWNFINVLRYLKKRGLINWQRNINRSNNNIEITASNHHRTCLNSYTCILYWAFLVDLPFWYGPFWYGPFRFWAFLTLIHFFVRSNDNNSICEFANSSQRLRHALLL